MSKSFSFSIALPKDYRTADFFAFHKRDSSKLAEHVHDNLLTKGIVWRGNAIQLEIKFQKKCADIKVRIDEVPYQGDELPSIDEFQNIINRMLGLEQNITDFEHAFINHTQLGPLIVKNPGLRVAVTATPFEALSWAIIGQQISLSAAISIRRRFIQSFGIPHSSGLFCYPDEYIVSALNEENLRQVGFSQAKANTLITISKYLIASHISLKNVELNKNSIEHLSNQLLQIRGIGQWSVNYALLRGFGWLDGSLHGDVAVRRSLQVLLGADDRIAEKHTQQWLLEFSPWRALVAAHLWEMYK